MIKHGVGGLALAAHWARRGDPDPASVHRMLNAAPHRGTNARTYDFGRATLGVSDQGAPAGLASTNNRGVAYAGVIDNPEVLDPSLKKIAGGDAVAAALADKIDQLGFEATVASLRGIFTIVSTDGVSLSCARDQVGFSALFYRDDGDRVWVASEPKQVVAGSGIRREPNLEVVEHIFFGLTALDMPTALAGVARLPRHHLLHFTPAGIKRLRLFDPESVVESSSVGLSEIPEAFNHLMDQAVRRVMRGPDALALSGGVDSPAVAAYAAPAHVEVFGTPLVAMSNFYPSQPFVDESQYIVPTAEYFGMPLLSTEPKSKPTDGLAEWVSLLDGPVPVVSIAESAELYQWVRSSGFEVLMTGEFAEFVADADRNLLSHLIYHGRIGPAIDRLKGQLQAGKRGSTLARELGKATIPSNLVKGYKRLRGRPVSAVRPPWITHGPIPVQYADIPLRRRWDQEQVSFFGGAAILLEAHDILQSRFGIKVRQPWADLELWKFFLALRAEVKYAYPTSKGLLRHMLRGRVPDLILDRRDKTVFDDNLRSKIDRQALADWLIDPPNRMPWIDYDILAGSIWAPNLGLREFMWMKDLAGVHAFLNTW